MRSRTNTRSAVNIFSPLRVFTKEPIREQEIKLGCMNCFQSKWPHLVKRSIGAEASFILMSCSGRSRGGQLFKY